MRTPPPLEGQASVQAAPFRVAEVGGASLACHRPSSPAVTLPPAGIVRFQVGAVIVTVAPAWVAVAFQAEVTRWSPPRVTVAVQPSTAVARLLVMVTSATKPVGHSEVVWYPIWHVGGGG